MDIKTLILDKFARRKSAKGPLGNLLKSQSSKVQQQQLAELVEETILPRSLIVVGTEKRLELDAARGKAFKVTSLIDGEERSVDLKNDADPEMAHAEAAEIFQHFLLVPEDYTISYSAISPPDESIAGLSADGLLAQREVPKPSDTQTQAGKRAPSPQEAPPAAPSISARFLEKTQRDISGFRSYDTNKPETAEAEAFSDAFSQLYQKLSVPLDGPLLCVAMAHNADQDTFVYVLDKNEGAVVELNRQRLGKICLAWNKLLGE